MLRDVTASLGRLLAAADPSDPARQRLFPRAVGDDDEADAELRELIQDDLAGVKRAGVEAIGGLLDAGTRRGATLRVALDDDDALLVLGVLNDVRLAIGARVGVERIDRDQVDPVSPDAYRLAVMDHLGMWQELLLALIDPPAVGDPPDPLVDPDDPRAP